MTETTEKSHHHLHHQRGLTLVPVRDAAVKHDQGGVSVIVPREDRCGGCGRHLFTLFDFDLRHPACAFLGMQGQRLRIAMCPTCTLLDEAVLTDVDGNGFSQWSRENGEEPVEPLEDVDDWEDCPPLPAQQLQLGPLHTTPYKGAISCRQKGLSSIGGVPTWIHTPEYRYCPGCQQKMSFIGQLALADVRDDAEGIIYAFLCSTCGKAATGYQQT